MVCCGVLWCGVVWCGVGRRRKYWWKCREYFAGRKCVQARLGLSDVSELGRLSAAAQDTSSEGKEWCFGKPVTWDKTEWKYLCGRFFSQIQIFKWPRHQQSGDKFWAEYEIRGPGGGEVSLACLSGATFLSYNFLTFRDGLVASYLPSPHTSHSSMQSRAQSTPTYFPVCVCYDLKTVRLEVDLWLPQ